MWPNVVPHISLAVALHNYGLKISRWLSVTRIHSLAHLLLVNVGRTETSLTSLLVAATFDLCWGRLMLFSLLVFVRFLILLLFSHTSYFHHREVLPSKVTTANTPSSLFLVDVNCWLLFSLAVAKPFNWIVSKACFSRHLLSHLILYWLDTLSDF